ncbi:MarR family winged helix-turn-helix transcriptional regulator [Carboxylicivirga caseinilyticus]|uniref:MarR family winged helix-turn-helix transcriptional regulator n=1 Tax=Carboxylicivirga caseinilyticus TaxID=3417572 RepID=UPI003D33EBA5|nr:MarR family transcriptional regulator [Marinilabiliaceae bacterium A049]
MEIQPLGMILGGLKGIFPRLMANRMSELGITYTFDQMVVLMIVRHSKQKQLVQQDIAEHMKKDKSLVLRIVDVLEKDGLIVRITDPNDRRRNIINITGKGVDLTDLFYAEEQLITKELMVGLTDEEIYTFYKVINHVKTRAEEF